MRQVVKEAAPFLECSFGMLFWNALEIHPNSVSPQRLLWVFSRFPLVFL